MTCISSELLFLEGCLDYLDAYRLSRALLAPIGEKGAQKPRWEWIIEHEDCTSADVIRLLRILGAKQEADQQHLLGREVRSSLLSERTSNRMRLLDVILRDPRFNEDCLIPYFSLLSDLTEQECFDHFYQRRHRESFIQSLCETTSAAKSSLLYRAISELTPEHQLELYAYSGHSGQSLLGAMASQQRGLVDNGFMMMMEAFAHLLKRFADREPIITKASVYLYIFKNEESIRSFYQLVIKSQPDRAIYTMMRSGAVPESHYKYLKEARFKVLHYIESMSDEARRYEHLLHLRDETREEAKMLLPLPGRFFNKSQRAWRHELDRLIEKYRPRALGHAGSVERGESLDGAMFGLPRPSAPPAFVVQDKIYGEISAGSKTIEPMKINTLSFFHPSMPYPKDPPLPIKEDQFNRRI